MTTFIMFSVTTNELTLNTHYLNRAAITNSAALEAAARFNYVALEYQCCQPSSQGFITSDCLVMDVDNAHTENSDE